MLRNPPNSQKYSAVPQLPVILPYEAESVLIALPELSPHTLLTISCIISSFNSD